MSLNTAEAVDWAWRYGYLKWKLRPVQLRMYDAIATSNELKYVVNSSRRIGKSFELNTLALETALQNTNVQVRCVAPTQKMLKNITLPIFRELCKDAPPDVKPIWKVQDAKFVCPSTGSEIYIAGVNNGHADDSRGTAAHAAFVDEAGFVDDLDYLVDDILMPQLLTTGGRLVMMSTPPRTPAHAFVSYVQEAQERGAYAEFNIYDSGYPPDLIEKFKREAGGEHSTTWLREYMCQFVVDEDYAIIPEWRDQYLREWPRDKDFWRFYHLYEGMDMGVVDKTVVLFGYYDFRAAKMIIEDELVMHGPQMTTNLLASAVRSKERELWTTTDMRGATITREPYVRIADNNNPLMLQDLGSLHGLHFSPTQKQGRTEKQTILEAMVNQVREFVAGGRLIVHPRCKQTVGCLKFGVWEDNRRTFARSAVYGHFDALAALIYLINNIDTQTNPIPADFGLNPNTHYIDPSIRRNPQADTVRAILGMRRHRR